MGVFSCLFGCWCSSMIALDTKVGLQQNQAIEAFVDGCREIFTEEEAAAGAPLDGKGGNGNDRRENVRNPREGVGRR
jgi:hypothetical protein